MTDAISNVNQSEYMNLFMQELTYQDPLKPIDNREFMAQMAQFSALEQAQASNDLMGKLAGMTSGNQSLMLLGKTVKFSDSNEPFKVYGVSFPENSQPELMISMNGASVKRGLNEVTEVSN